MVVTQALSLMTVMPNVVRAAVEANAKTCTSEAKANAKVIRPEDEAKDKATNLASTTTAVAHDR